MGAAVGAVDPTDIGAAAAGAISEALNEAGDNDFNSSSLGNIAEAAANGAALYAVGAAGGVVAQDVAEGVEDLLEQISFDTADETTGDPSTGGQNTGDPSTGSTDGPSAGTVISAASGANSYSTGDSTISLNFSSSGGGNGCDNQ